MAKVNPSDDSEVEDRLLCSRCVGEKYLQAKVEMEGNSGSCHYCGKTGKTFAIGEFADCVDTAMAQHFQRTSTEPSSFQSMMMQEDGASWDREGEPVVSQIAWMAKIDEIPAEDVRLVLEDRHADMERAQMGEEGPFDESAQYEDKEASDSELQENWRNFEKILKTEARFYNAQAAATLGSVFDGLDEHKKHDGHPVIVKAGPGSRMPALFRARVFQATNKLEEALKRPDKEIGPPPMTSALAGRMNARGISIFYGATSAGIAVSEVRPPVGSRVVVAKFKLLREVRLLDVEALSSISVRGSVFDGQYIVRLERAKFLKTLSGLMTTPVMPDDEPLDYLVTQTIADYLASRPDLALDGVLYPSVQGRGRGSNVALFHKASCVESMELPKGTEVTASTESYSEDGPEDDYWVFEKVPGGSADKTEKNAGLALAQTGAWSEPGGTDSRKPTLRLNPKSLRVHHVEAAKYKTEDFRVHRSRLEKRDLDAGLGGEWRAP